MFEKQAYESREDAFENSTAWSKGLKRLARRHQIRLELKTGNESLSAIKDTVRAFEEAHKTDTLIQELVENEVVIPPAVNETMLKVSELVREKFPEVEALVLLGSGSHGGSVVRTITNHFEDMDIDWGIITRDKVTRDRRVQIAKFFNKSLKQVAAGIDSMENVRGCCGINPGTHELLSQVTLENASGFLDRFETVLDTPLEDYSISGHTDYPEYFTPTTPIFLYLNPSYPPIVNQKNRRIVKEGLKVLYNKECALWENAMCQLLREWHLGHGLSMKHFPRAIREDGNPRDFALMAKVVDASSEVMSQPFVENMSIEEEGSP